MKDSKDGARMKKQDFVYMAVPDIWSRSMWEVLSSQHLLVVGGKPARGLGSVLVQFVWRGWERGQT